MKYKVADTGVTVELNDSTYRAEGGEGVIHIIGDVVYKVCDPDKMIPEAKFLELRQLAHPRIIVPESILLDSKRRKTGYTMKLVPGEPKNLARMLSKSYREREHIGHDQATSWVSQMLEAMKFVHSHPGFLQIDGNERNYMITNDYKDVYLIDVNSFQTPTFPATAILPSILDYRCPIDPTTHLPKFSKETDYYSFAIMSFFIFTGTHPYMGRNSGLTKLPDLMRAGKSVLDPKTEFATGAIYFPFENFIPGGNDGAWMRWYRALFVDNKRLAPPSDFQSKVGAVVTVTHLQGTNNFIISPIHQYAGTIVGYYSSGSMAVVETSEGLFYKGNKFRRPNGKFRVAFTDKKNLPMLVSLEDGHVRVKDLHTGGEVKCNLAARDLMHSGGRVYLLSDTTLVELGFIEGGAEPIAAANTYWNIMPKSTQLFQGVMFQDMMGTRLTSIFPERKQHISRTIPELIGVDIIDAKCDGNVLMAVILDRKSGRYDRLVFRFDSESEWKEYDVRRIENVVPTGLNFTVLPTGVCVSITEDDKVELFSCRKDSSTLKSVSDPAVRSDMRLCRDDSAVRVAKGDTLYQFSMK